MIKTLSRFRLPRNWVLFTTFPFLVSAAVLPTSGSAREPHFSQPIVTQGWTRAGYPYLNGGISFDQRRAMERAASGYNLKLVFANHVGTPAMPSFLVIGANDGSPIEKISLHGPWFYIRLPAGSYTSWCGSSTTRRS